MSIGVPVKMLHEAEGHIVTLESATGETYRGKLIEAEDNMNCQLASVTVTARDGKSSQVEHVYIRGSNIKFVIIPDMLKNAPMFKNVDKSQRGAGEQAMKTRILRERIGRGRGSGNPQRGGWSGGGRGGH